MAEVRAAALGEGEPETAAYVCEGCDAPIAEHHKTAMLEGGEWRATAVSADPSTIGFHLSAHPLDSYKEVLAKLRVTPIARMEAAARGGAGILKLAGTVVEAGPGVRRWALGQRVTVPFVCGCGRCEWCRSGQAQVCPDQQQPGFTHWGSFAEYVALHAADANLVPVADVVADAAAAGLGCRFATAYRALHGRAGVRPGEWVTVVGVGGVGLSAVQVAVAAGARVVAVDRTPAALELAVGLGAEHAVLAGHGGERSDGGEHRNVAAQVHELTDGGSHSKVILTCRSICNSSAR